jgi:hypothetical protein
MTGSRRCRPRSPRESPWAWRQASAPRPASRSAARVSMCREPGPSRRQARAKPTSRAPPAPGAHEISPSQHHTLRSLLRSAGARRGGAQELRNPTHLARYRLASRSSRGWRVAPRSILRNVCGWHGCTASDAGWVAAARPVGGGADLFPVHRLPALRAYPDGSALGCTRADGGQPRTGCAAVCVCALQPGADLRLVLPLQVTPWLLQRLRKTVHPAPRFESGAPRPPRTPRRPRG